MLQSPWTLLPAPTMPGGAVKKPGKQTQHKRADQPAEFGRALSSHASGTAVAVTESFI